MEENIVKRVCKELGISYQELADILGVGISTINNSASTGKVSKQLETAINLYLKNIELEKELEEYNNLKATLKKAIL